MFISLKAIISRNRSGIAVSLKIFVFLKNNLLQHTAREARIASAPAALICPKIKRGKDPWSFSPLGSPFSFTTLPAKSIRSDKDRSAKRKKRKKRSARGDKKHAKRSDKGRNTKRTK